MSSSSRLTCQGKEQHGCAVCPFVYWCWLSSVSHLGLLAVGCVQEQRAFKYSSSPENVDGNALPFVNPSVTAEEKAIGGLRLGLEDL